MSKSNDLYADAQAGSKTAHYMALALKHKARTEQLEAINAELLEALEEIVNYVEYDLPSTDLVLNKARAAIKHAKGEAV